MGLSNDNEIFVATNVTNFPQGTLNGTLIVTASNSNECNTEAYDNSLPFKFETSVDFVVNQLGMVEGENGWHTQPIRELEGNSTLPISLVELMKRVAEPMSGVAELFSGVTFDYGLVVYVLGAEKELLGCASMEKVDEGAAAEYSKMIFGISQEAAVKEEPSSASKNDGLFVFVFMSAIAAVGIAAMLGDVLAL